MISYLPALYKDEIFCSFEARIHAHTLSRSPVSTRLALYGRPDFRTSIYFPKRLGFFISSIKHFGFVDFNALVARHTLWPIFSMFYRTDFHLKILNLMEHGHSPRNAGLPLRVRNEITYLNAVPKYCPQCNLESLKQNGEIFFNRVHQIPDIIVCPYHFCFLEESEIENNRSKLNLIVVPSLRSCPIVDGRQSSNRELNRNSHFFLPILEEAETSQIDYKSVAREELCDPLLKQVSMLLRKHQILEINKRLRNTNEILTVLAAKLQAELEQLDS